MEKNELIILEYLDEYGLDIFTKSQLLTIKSITPGMIIKGLKDLVDIGHIKKIEKGKYCRQNFADEFVIGNFLIKRGGIAYWTAMNYHGLTEQIPNIIFIQTDQWKKDKEIFGTQYKFIQVGSNKITGYKTEGYGNHRFRITDIEKTIVDSFDLPKYSGGYPEVIKAFHHAKINSRKLVRYCKALGNIAIIKRIAYLTELLNKKDMEIFIEYALQIRNENFDPFLHYGKKAGKTNKRWKLMLNLSEEEIINMTQS